MSKGKKRVVSVAGVRRTETAPEEAAAEERLPAKQETSVRPPAPAHVVAAERAGLETKAVFWFILGALTTGILVLIGLLLLTPAAAKPAAPTAVAGKNTSAPLATATRPIGVTVIPVTRAPATLDPSYAATFTAIAAANASVPRISLQEAKSKLDAKTALVVDVRSRDSFAERHIKGAINVPVDQIDSLLSRLPKDQDLILYCS